MAAIAFQQPSIDRLSRVHMIREAFARSPLFQEAAISDPVFSPEGKVSLALSFDRGPAVFRVVAGFEDEAYAILYDLAVAMVEIERSHCMWC